MPAPAAVSAPAPAVLEAVAEGPERLEAARHPTFATRPSRGTRLGSADQSGHAAASAPSEEPAADAVRARPSVRAPVDRIFTLGPTPQNVDVYLDGEKKFAYDPDHKTISVPWAGNHTIELRSPAGCCFSERIEVGPDHPVPPDNIIARKLKWKAARLTIATDPPVPKARVIVKDPSGSGSGTLAKVGEDVAIPFNANDERSKEVEVDVDTGDSFTSARITVHAGEQSSHLIKLVTSKPGTLDTKTNN
jgi:hypothetical protein